MTDRPRIRDVGIKDARGILGALIDDVIENGDVVYITRSSKRVAELVAAERPSNLYGRIFPSHLPSEADVPRGLENGIKLIAYLRARDPLKAPPIDRPLDTPPRALTGELMTLATTLMPSKAALEQLGEDSAKEYRSLPFEIIDQAVIREEMDPVVAPLLVGGLSVITYLDQVPIDWRNTLRIPVGPTETMAWALTCQFLAEFMDDDRGEGAAESAMFDIHEKLVGAAAAEQDSQPPTP